MMILLISSLQVAAGTSSATLLKMNEEKSDVDKCSIEVGKLGAREIICHSVGLTHVDQLPDMLNVTKM